MQSSYSELYVVECLLCKQLGLEFFFEIAWKASFSHTFNQQGLFGDGVLLGEAVKTTSLMRN